MKKAFTDPLLAKMFGEKGTLCVSILVPMYKISPDRNQNPVRARHAVENALSQLGKIKAKDEKEKQVLRKISDDIGKLYEKIDFVRAQKGVGIFVSENITHLVYFPFDIAEKIIVGDSFEIRDMLYKEHYLAEYLVLALSMNSARLFSGRDGIHNEIADENFPLRFRDDFIYEKPSPGSPVSVSLKSTEKDKSIMKLIRLKEFYRQADALLANYLKENVPIIISGVAKCLSSFLEVTRHQKKIIAQVAGNYSGKKKEEFEMKTWKKVLQHQRDSETALLKELENRVKTKSLVSGLKKVWKNAEEGRGLFLVVEKDFRQPGFERPGDKKLFAHANGSPLKIHDDAVDDLIEMVLEKNGTVSFVKNGSLKKMQRIALVTRYKADRPSRPNSYLCHPI